MREAELRCAMLGSSRMRAPPVSASRLIQWITVMKMQRSVRFLSAFILLGVFAIACGTDATSPASLRTPAVASASRGGTSAITTIDDPTFLRPAPGAPAIANPVIVFTVKKGDDKIVRMYYHRGTTGRDSVIFAQFRVQSQSLDSWPDGRRIQSGEAVTITMTLVDAEKGIIEFQPSGLRFSASHPAILKISYRNADHDFNGDGTINALDTAIEHTLRIICRESPTDPWFPVPSFLNTELDEVEAAIYGFTGYAIDAG